MEAIQGKEGVIDPNAQGTPPTAGVTGQDPAPQPGEGAPGGGEAGGELGPQEGGGQQGDGQGQGTGEFILESVHEARMAKAQSSWQGQINERENRIRELEAQISQGQQFQPQPQPPAAQPPAQSAESALLSDQDFVDRLNRQDGTALKMLSDAIRKDTIAAAQAAAQQQIQAFTQQQQQEAQRQNFLNGYVSQMDALCEQAGLTEQEVSHAQQLALTSRDANGFPTISPQEAVMTARFGSLEKAYEFADAQRAALLAAQPGAGQPPAQQAGTPATQAPTPPPMPAGSPGNVPTNPETHQPVVQERGWRNAGL